MGKLMMMLLLAASPAFAQPSVDIATRDRLTWKVDQRHVADVVSYGTVTTNLLLKCLDTRTRDCYTTQAIRAGVGIGIAEITKRVVHRERPDWSDRKSFYSMHTMLGCGTLGRSKREIVGLITCVSTAYLRIAGKKHWLTDVAVGATAGVVLSRWRK